MHFWGLVGCFGLFISSLHAQTTPPTMEASFLGKLKSAVAQKDYAAFSALICHDGTLDSDFKATVEKSDQAIFRAIISNAAPNYAFASVPSSQITSFTYKGKKYQTNLKPVDTLKISFPDAAPNTTTAGSYGFPLGIKNGNLLIVHTEQVP